MAKAKTSFPLYDCLVRLSGSRNNEVFRQGVTAPEIMVLATVHGGDAIANVKPTKLTRKEYKHGDAVERDRLQQIYEGRNPGKRGFIGKVFGPVTIPLPREHEGAAVASIEPKPTQAIPADLEEHIDPAASVMS